MKKALLIIFLIVITLEITVFNVNSYRVLNNNGKREFTPDKFSYVEEEENSIYVEIKDINTEVKTLHIKLAGFENVEYQVLYTDETSSNLRDLPRKEYVPQIEKSKYIPCFLSGESSTIAVRVFSVSTPIESITINEKIPFDFNLTRVLIVYGIIVFIYLLKTREIFKVPYSLKSFSQEMVLLTILFVFIFISYWLVDYSTSGFEGYDDYCESFIEALSKGQIYLDKKPSEKLMNLENPYDDGQRVEAGLNRGTDFLWDVAYYNGKYYIYFGILPALILMLPYYMITHVYMSSAVAVLIFSILTAISLKALIKNIFLRFFKEMPFKFMVFSLLILLFGSQVLWLDGIPRFYELAIISGIFFSITGINFMFSATKNEKVNYFYMFLSALFLSLAVACRPTQVLVSFIIAPILLRIFIRNIKDKKDILKNILAILIPYALVSISLMYYNYVRFGSILEFGSSYQLTVNDMSNLRHRIMTIGMGIVCSLFSVPNFIPSFPFMYNHNNLVTFYGYYYIENMMGGLFVMVPICLFIFAIYKVWKRTENKNLLSFIVTFTVVGMLICLLSIMMGGSMQRYMADYAWILTVAGICIFIELVNLYKCEETKAIMRKLFGFLTIYIVFVNFCAGVISEKSFMRRNSPEEYYNFKYSTCFWE